MHDKLVFFRGTNLLETSGFAPLGFGRAGSLVQESIATEAMRRLGLPVALGPIEVRRLHIKGVEDAAFALFHVHSDFRVDELVYAVATSRGLPGQERRRTLQDIAEAEGALYARVHRAGFLRGMGNSWYGNEAVAADGELLLCDLENALDTRLMDSNLVRFYREFEVSFFANAVRRSLGEINWALAQAVVRSFEDSYSSACRKVADLAPMCHLRTSTGRSYIRSALNPRRGKNAQGQV